MKYSKKIKCIACQKNSLIFDCQYNKLYYYKCILCNLLQLVNPYSQTYLERLYETDMAVGDDKERNLLLHWLMNIPLGKWSFDILRHAIYKSRAASISDVTVDGKVLDIGCGTGEFLYYMKRKKWKTYGIEVSKQLVKIAKGMSKATIYETRLMQFKPKLKFDVITMWHVFEHLPNPESVIKKLSKILADDGTLVIEVPHGNSFSYKLFKRNWTLLLVPQHLHFWTESAFRILLARNNMKISKIEYPLHFPFVFASSSIKLNRIFIFFVVLLLPISAFITLLTSNLKSGEVIRIYAQKI
jgi:2-polyprenyl-3-methyl-5-hydroxy-6-metoxy-1,4-benzoquinol methylase